jgi:hypothetical protein
VSRLYGFPIFSRCLIRSPGLYRVIFIRHRDHGTNRLTSPGSAVSLQPTKAFLRDGCMIQRIAIINLISLIIIIAGIIIGDDDKGLVMA